MKQPTRKTQHPKKKNNYFHVYFFQKNKKGKKKFKKTMSGNFRGASTLPLKNWHLWVFELYKHLGYVNKSKVEFNSSLFFIPFFLVY